MPTRAPIPADLPAEPCPVCGEPVAKGDRGHAECARQQVSPPAAEQSRQGKKKAKAPQKTCARCGGKSHVRRLTCDDCGAMF